MTNKQYNLERTNVKEVVKVGLMSALIYIATATINIPIGPGGVVHLGDSMIFVTAMLFGWKTAALSGAIGMTLFDLLSPYAVWAPYTLVIKGVMGAMAGFISHSKERQGEKLLWNIIAVVVSGIWVILGYYIAEAMIYGNILAPMATIPANLFQVSAGAVIAIPLTVLLKRSGYFSK